MYTGLLHTHKLVVLLFVLIYIVKTLLLLAEQQGALEKVKRITRIPEMVISTLFLLTGIAMLVQLPEYDKFLWFKLIAVFASIPVAVIGFKKNNKALASLSLILILGGYGLAEVSKNYVERKEVSGIVSNPSDDMYDITAHGKGIYDLYCQSCHGADGTLGAAGAKNLKISQLTEEQTIAIITKGKNAMAAYSNVLSEDEIMAVATYIKSLKK
jgi:uncharacterized membrane protein SirB2/cytochrome c5